MKIPTGLALNLLHRCSAGTLATHSVALPGYPFASTLPFATDSRHRPLFLISQLAEHTRNLDSDPRASLALADPDALHAENAARLTMIGDVTRIDIDSATRDRYLRYLPHAALYLELGDFAFYRLEPRRIRLVAGFGRMGWIEHDVLESLPVLEADAEAERLAALAADSGICGLDRFGIDFVQDGERRRSDFADALDDDALSRFLQQRTAPI
ncbi:HugZ family protein [Paludibacterium yongneupense]|uniref:HugZ family pyridoxamine 5'-phosphate oxidase n=1 Tax=Paludibacterium yongneupense TaxID=400061 RepID=UPI0004056877|nr:pyridoxamine 5'-phosphate oxidase family protein [Paludibacterium yongneupense]